ncbi:MAG: hypothetical protein JEZ07_08600 [Phycisphaerae bacterium]|nr:hypothetical protein [Phycisphaerae bacterium]
MKKTIKFIICIIFTLAIYVQASTLNVINVHSDKMNKDVPVNIILPDSYQNSIRPFAVLYLLHGAGDDYTGWVKKTSIEQLVDQHNIIVVCPDSGRTSWYFDSPIDPTYQYEIFTAVELVKYIDKNYRTLASRDFRAITGLSMGGHGAMFLAIRHKDVFGVVGCQSGGVDIRPFPDNWDIKKRLGPLTENKERWNELTVINQAKTLKDNDLQICIDCGTSDFFLNVNRALHQQLLDDKISHVYTERPGGHSWDYWSNSIKYQMLFFTECFNKAKIKVQKDKTFNTALIAVPKLENDFYDWYQRHSDILKIKNKINPQIIIVGDSITHMWAGDPKSKIARGQQQWKNVFGKYRVLNSGFGWDRIQNVLWRIDNGEIDNIRPDVFIINIGTNNLAAHNARANTPAEITEGINEICQQIKNRHPRARIILMSIFPRGQHSTDNFRSKILETNKLLKTLSVKQQLEFLDIHDEFLDKDGNIPQELMGDFLHPTAKGYDIWADALQQKLAE